MSNFTDDQARDAFEKAKKKVNQSTFNKILNSVEEILDKFKNVPVLGQYLPIVPTMIGLIKDYINGRYKDVPYQSIISIAAALIYVLNPLDLIPDVIPGVGYLDDAAVIAMCLKFVKSDLDKYKSWRGNN